MSLLSVSRDLASGASGWKHACRVVATSNITLSGTQTVDGVALSVGDRVLVAGQTTATQNGLYNVFNGAWVRTDDADQPNDWILGMRVPVTSGSADNAGSTWTLTSPTTGSISLGSTSLTFEKSENGSPVAPLPSTAAVLQPSADTTGAKDRSAIQAALTAGRPVYLVPGATYYLDQPIAITVAAPGALLCLGAELFASSDNAANICRGSAFTPAAAGAADDPANCMLSYASTLAGADETTLSAAVRRGRTAISTTAGLTAPTGKTYRLRSIGTASGGVGTLATDVEITEIVTVASGSGPYTLDRGLGALHGAHVNSSNTTQIREVTTVVRNVVVRGVRFFSATSVSGSATQIACAVYLQHVIGADIDVKHFGFSRSAVEVRFSRDCQVRSENLGDSNGSVWERSCQDSRIEVRRRPSGAARFHANGTPRAELYVDYISTAGVYTGDVVGGVVGAEFVGYADAYVPRFHASDMDCTERVSDDATRLPDLNGSQAVGAGISVRAIQTGTTFDETPYGIVFGDVHLTQCGGPATDGQQCAFYAVNTQGMKVDSLTIENKASDSTVAAPFRSGGLLLHDCYSAQIDNLQTSGVENAFELYGSWARVHIGVWRWDPTNAHTNQQIALRWGLLADGSSQPISVTIGRWVCPDTPTFAIANLNGTTPDDRSRAGLDIGELLIENKTSVGSNYGRVRWFVGADSYTPATGELAEIIPPQVVTFDNATDTFTCTGHGLANGTPVYIRVQPNSVGVMPTGVSDTQVFWVVNRAANTFQVSLTKGGGAYTTGSTNGTAPLEVATVIPAVRTPSTGPAAARRHVVIVNGSSFGSGPLPAGYYLASIGPMCMVRTNDVAHPGDLLEVAASTGVANNNLASSDPFAVVLGAKPSATAAPVQCRRIG